MKKTNKKLIALLLSGMLGVAALSVGLMRTDVASAEGSATETKGDVEDVFLNEESEGVTYKYIALGDGENIVTDQAALDQEIAEYQAELEQAAEEASENWWSYIYLPSLDWLIEDDNGYCNLKFTICYKLPSSNSTRSASGLNYNSLRISTTDEGDYEFKIYATDSAGNGMQYYLDGELVTVNSANIWDIEEIPTFSFVFTYDGVWIKDNNDVVSKRKDSVVFNGTYSGFTDPTTIGFVNKQSAYTLYKVDTSVYNDTNSETSLTSEVMAEISYARLKEMLDFEFEQGNMPAEGDYFDFYLDLYVKALGEEIGVTSDVDLAKIKDCFVRINEYDSGIIESDSSWDTNKFKWNASNKSFEAVEECEYIIFADYYESELSTQRIAAYKVIEVESENIENSTSSDESESVEDSASSDESESVEDSASSDENESIEDSASLDSELPDGGEDSSSEEVSSEETSSEEGSSEIESSFDIPELVTSQSGTAESASNTKVSKGCGSFGVGAMSLGTLAAAGLVLGVSKKKRK